MKVAPFLWFAMLSLAALSGLPSAVAADAPRFISAPKISGEARTGSKITIDAAATNPNNAALTTVYNYGDGFSDSLGAHTYSVAGTYPLSVTVSDGQNSATSTISITIKEIANLWIQKQTIQADTTGKGSWHAQYIYNADRTLAAIFNPATDDFVATLGTIPLIKLSPSGVAPQRFSGIKPKLFFKSAKGVKPVISVILNESNQTISISGTSETFADTVPGPFLNTLQLGKVSYSVDEFFTDKGAFTANSGYRSAAFVVQGASVKVVKPGKDSATVSMLLGDPAFAFPSMTGSKTVHVRATNVVNQIIFEQDFPSVISKAGKLTAPGGAFSYDSNKGTLNFKLSKATLTGFLVTSEENVRVDVTIGDQTYTTHVTLFTSGCGKTVVYSTKLPKKFCKFIPGRIVDTTSPTVLSTIPVNSAVGVAINTKLSATFSEAMDPSSINTNTFTLTQGITPIAGTVTYSSNGFTAVFVPTNVLSSNSPFTATLTTGAKDLAGNALLANVTWNFTTSAAADTTPPHVISTNPADQASGVAINQTVNATFDKAMDPATLSVTTFTLAVSGANAGSVSGAVTYDSVNKIATFTPESNLTPGAQYTATLTTSAKDLAGNALAAAKTWSFSVSAQNTLMPMPVPLGAATPYGTFGGGSGMTNQGIFTVVNGDIGTTGASTTVTGFHDSTGDIYTETPLNKGQVNGRIYTAPPTPGGAGVGGNASTYAIGVQAASDAVAAYNKLTPASMPGGIDPGAGQLGGLTLPPGIYKAAGDTFLITGSDLTLDAHGDANAVWVFQMGASLTVGAPAAPRSVILTNGAQAKNVFWQVGSSATINAAGGGTMVGTIIASAGVTISTAGNVTLVTLNGRALGLNASTTLVNTVINVPAP